MTHVMPIKVALLGGAILLLCSCSSIDSLFGNERPDASIKSVKLSGIDLDSARLAIDLEVRNPYSVALPIAALQATLSSDGQRIVETSHDGQLAVPPRGSSIVPLEVDLSFAKIIRLVSSLRPGMTVPYRADLTVAVDAPVLGRVAIPLSHEDAFPIPAPPGISLSNMVLDKAGLGGIAGRISLELTNANDFAMTDTNMDLELRLGDRSLSRLRRVGDIGDLASGQSRTLDLAFDLSPTEMGLGLLQMLTGSSASVRALGKVGYQSQFGLIGTEFDSRDDVGVTKR